MDTPNTPPLPVSPPPPSPTPPRPLGRTFVLTLLAPLLPLILCIVIGLAEGRGNDSAAPYVFLFLSLPVMLGCSIACAIQVGSRKGAGLGILTFIGTQILYISVAFGGCLAAFSNANFH
jgi:hypothetical protein